MRFTLPTRNYDGDWTLWFAWHPVKVGTAYVWLEQVRRRRRYGQEAAGFWQYSDVQWRGDR